MFVAKKSESEGGMKKNLIVLYTLLILTVIGVVVMYDRLIDLIVSLS